MRQYLDILNTTLHFGEERDTRSGKVISMFDAKFKQNLRGDYIAVMTTKKLMWRAVVGELLWFLSGSTDIRDLKHYTFNDPDSDKWTIWTEDLKRWNVDYELGDDNTSLGRLYGIQWRQYEDHVDQITNLIERIKNNPTSRYQITMAWNPSDIDDGAMALAPCHLGFQTYVSNDGHLSLKWWQRSVDSFLGLPFNIASYGLLLHILARLTGNKVGELVGDLGDVHIYKQHEDAVKEQLQRKPYAMPRLNLPKFDTLEELLELTADDFMDALDGYQSHPAIKAPLLVGK